MAVVRKAGEVSNGYIGYDGPDLPYSQQGPLRDNPGNPGAGTSNGVKDPNDPTGGMLPEYTGGSVPGAQLPGTANRDRVAGGFKSQLAIAREYLNNMKSNSDRAYQTYANESRKKLDRSIKGVKEDFNARGLLGSGLQADRVAGTTTAANVDLDNRRAEINQGLLGNLGQLEGNAFDTASILAQRGPDTANPYLSGVGSNIAAQSADSALAAEMYGQIGQGVGAIGGAGLGSLIQQGNRGYNPISGSKPMGGYYDFTKGSGKTYA